MSNYEKYIGQVFDNRYRIDALIGVGGMAVVYKAVDLLMRRIVAVKILRDDISADDASIKRFINESKAVAMLSHPNIVNIYDVSVRDNVKYIVMEYIEGITLKNYMTRREVLGFKETLSYTMQILRALDHAHKKGIVHRDIKPQNIMLLRDGVIKVMDFGIAKLPNADTVTMSDKAIGTVYYISPEQASGEVIDDRSDLYSLGVLLYEMSTGRLPFEADSPVSVALMQVNDTPESPRNINSKIPQGLEQIIMRAMEKEPSRRYQSAEQMLDCLEKLKENPSIIFKPKASEKFKNFFQKRHPLGKISKSMLPIILGVFVPFFIAFSIFGVYLFTNVFNDSSINDYETIEVDNYVGATFTSELEKSFKDSAYFRLAGVEYQYDEDTPMGVIIGQSPSAGEMKRVLKNKRFCNITLVISGGTEKFTLKDYVLDDYRLVKSELNSMKIKVNIIKQESVVHLPGTILPMSPEPGTVIKVGESVDLYISRGAGEEDLLMPDLVGKDEAEVLLIMVENKLRVGKITYEKSSEPVGTVISQSIEKETPTYFYTVVDFVLSGGEKYGEIETTKPPETDPDSDSESTEKREPSSGMQSATNTTATSNDPSEVTSNDPSEDTINGPTTGTKDEPKTPSGTTGSDPKPVTPTDKVTDSDPVPTTPVDSSDTSTEAIVTPSEPISSETDPTPVESEPKETPTA